MTKENTEGYLMDGHFSDQVALITHTMPEAGLREWYLRHKTAIIGWAISLCMEREDAQLAVSMQQAVKDFRILYAIRSNNPKRAKKENTNV